MEDIKPFVMVFYKEEDRWREEPMCFFGYALDENDAHEVFNQMVPDKWKGGNRLFWTVAEEPEDAVQEVYNQLGWSDGLKRFGFRSVENA